MWRTIIHILQAYSIDNYDVYVISNGIFASANEDKEDACSVIRDIPLGSVNLGKIAALNQLARDICSMHCSLIDAWDRLEECKNLKSYPEWVQVLSSGIGSAGFSYLFGGQPIDAGFAFLIGTVEQLLLDALSKKQVSKVLQNVFASILVATLSTLISLTALPVLPDKIVIGAIMPLVPGIALTTGIRDIFNGDYLAGTIHLISALMTAICIAVGVCVPLAVHAYFTGGALI